MCFITIAHPLALLYWHTDVHVLAHASVGSNIFIFHITCCIIMDSYNHGVFILFIFSFNIQCTDIASANNGLLLKYYLYVMWLEYEMWKLTLTLRQTERLLFYCTSNSQAFVHDEYILELQPRSLVFNRAVLLQFAFVIIIVM